MKKVCLLAVAACLTFAANAQKNVTFGVKGGLNIANVSNTSSDATRTSGFAGGLAQIEINENWSVQPEIMFSGQGFKYNDIARREITGAINYINVPVMVQYYLIPEFNLEAGAQVGIKVGAKYKRNGDSNNVNSDFTTADFGLGFGCAYEFPIHLGISARYMFGITDIAKAGVANLSDGAQRNSVAQIGVFYKFR
ncbi:outer membrane protein with beta-barrel domain [Chitinophaga skermanii]|uniref:Outer membrane protein with beta-barrel domain n=1 Tax=Chitinophaga skermanii TaxID=331697 RepID=A0A327QLA0_9BACT|nr:porin family protein [Chitinophaga skermanii]RAJ05070.1 outer membrane protein with beta-barrel domain [Chitinophaga skermanii]